MQGNCKKWIFLTQIGFLILFVLWLGIWGRKDVASSHFDNSTLKSRQVQEVVGGILCVFLAVNQGAACEEPQKVSGRV